MKKVKRYLQGGPTDASPDDGTGGGGVTQSGGYDIPETGTMRDVNTARQGLRMNDDGEIRSAIRGLGPSMAGSRLERQGVDLPGLIGGRAGQGFDAGPQFKKGGSVGSASKRADGCAQRGKTKGKMR